MKNGWRISAAVCCGMGKIRHNNEDSFYLNGRYQKFSEMNQEIEWTEQSEGDGSLWAVCDGMGGMNNGEMASFTAVSGMADLQHHMKGRDFGTTLQSWIRQADHAVSERTQGGGCTLVLIYGQEEKICYAHVGDSRIYRVHQGKLIRLTRDHSKVEMLMAAGIITPEEAETHPQRHVITRNLGMDSETPLEATIGNPLPVMNGDRYILCSDGITDMLKDAEIAGVAEQIDNAKTCAEKLYQEALRAGGRDNLTVMVLDVEQDEECETEDEDESSDPTVENDVAEDQSVNVGKTISVDVERTGCIKSPCEVVIRQADESGKRVVKVSVS